MIRRRRMRPRARHVTAGAWARLDRLRRFQAGRETLQRAAEAYEQRALLALEGELRLPSDRELAAALQAIGVGA